MSAIAMRMTLAISSIWFDKEVHPLLVRHVLQAVLPVTTPHARLIGRPDNISLKAAIWTYRRRRARSTSTSPAETSAASELRLSLVSGMAAVGSEEPISCPCSGGTRRRVCGTCAMPPMADVAAWELEPPDNRRLLELPLLSFFGRPLGFGFGSQCRPRRMHLKVSGHNTIEIMSRPRLGD